MKTQIVTLANETGMGISELIGQYAGRIGKYADPTEGAREGLSAEDALAVAREDAGLLYVTLTSNTVAPVTYYAVREQDYDTCETLRWEWMSVAPMVVASGTDEDEVSERGARRAGCDVRLHANVERDAD